MELVDEFCSYENRETAQKRLISLVDFLPVMETEELLQLEMHVCMLLSEVSHRFSTALRENR